MKNSVISLLIQFILFFPITLNSKDLCCWKKMTMETEDVGKFVQTYNVILTSFFHSDKEKLRELSSVNAYKDVPTYLKYYFACLSNFYLGVLSENNRKLLEKYLENAKDLCEKSVENNPTFAESRRLLSVIYGWMIDIKWYLAPFYGQNVDAQVRRAYVLNDESPMVMEAIGISLLYTPVIFGGDKNKAGEWFLKAYNSCPSCPEIQYWLAIYYLETKKHNKLCSFYNRHTSTFQLPAFKSVGEKINSICTGER